MGANGSGKSTLLNLLGLLDRASSGRYFLNERNVTGLSDERGVRYATWRYDAQGRAILSEHPARWMLWEAEPLPDTVGRLRELGVASVVFDPAGNRPGEGDYLSVMQANLDRLEAALLGG